jgi:flagellar biosynthesis protein
MKIEDESKNSRQKAVALKYDREIDDAPKVVAKGEGEVAKKIIKMANEYDLPIKKDPDLVEMLAQLEIDREIPPNLYKAVAEVFSFIYKLTNKTL